MTIEALWTAEFQTAQGWDTGGVVVLETNRLYCGDSQYYYVGSCNMVGNEIEAKLSVNHYFGPISTAWATSEKKFSVNIRGKIEGNTITGVMFRPEFPHIRQQVRLTLRENLP